jgi:ABC-type transport system involved in Fe-S cluster assembly fused permease/ATPase subunit
VQAALDQILSGDTQAKRTTIVIAHRLSTIRNADKICILVGLLQLLHPVDP